MHKSASPPRLTSEVPRLPERDPSTHKGQVGRVAVVAGCRGMSGAAILCGLGALRAGAGLVRVYAPASVAGLVAAAEPSLMTVPVEEDALGCIRGNLSIAVDSDWADVLALGPGLGRSPDLERTVAALVDVFKGAMVIDADGLNNLASHKREAWLHHRARQTVLTPHPGEMARLRRGLGLDDVDLESADEARVAAASEFARLTGTVVVLKGHRTVVSTAEEAYINTTGNPGMAAGGMGDVLTGVIAALLGQGLDGFAAARLGVYVHGLAADRLARDVGPVGYLAREVASRIASTLAEACRSPVGFR